MQAAPAVYLIAYPDDDRQQQQVAAHAGKAVVEPDDGVYKDADHDHDEQKARPAAGMEAGLLTDVLDRELLSVLVAEDGLMLRAVVGEQTLHVAHAGTQLHVREQDNDANKTL